MRKNIKAHSSKHIFQIFLTVMGKNLRQLHQAMIIKAWLLEIQFKQSSRREHMNLVRLCFPHSISTIKSLCPKISRTFF